MESKGHGSSSTEVEIGQQISPGPVPNHSTASAGERGGRGNWHFDTANLHSILISFMDLGNQKRLIITRYKAVFKFITN